MQKRSSDSAAIRLPSRETLIRKLKRIAAQMLEDFDEVEEVVLFGSLARGDDGIDSDADVLIVLSSSPYKRYFDRIPRYARAFLEFDTDVDVFPYTRAEFNRMQEDENPFITSMLEEGISLKIRNYTVCSFK